MISEIHQSTLNMILRCGEQFRRRYIEGHIIPPSIAACRGTGTHGANEANLKQKIHSKKDLSLDDMKDAARDGYVHNLKKGIYLPKEEQPSKIRLVNEGLNDTLRCTEVYATNVAPNIQPISVEKKFEIDIGLPLKLAGTIDYQEQPELGDLKTSTKKWPQGRAESEIQAPFYSFVHEHETKIRPRFVYHVLIARRNKDGWPTSIDYDPHIIEITDSMYQALFAKIRLFIDSLKKGIFMPANPTSWWCNSRY